MNSTSRSLRLLVVFLPLIALALGSFWLVEVMRRAMDDAGPVRERSEPDFYIEDFSYVKMSASGKPQYHISGSRLTHNPQDGSYDVQSPLVVALSNPGAPVKMRSERAHVNSDGSEVRLYEDAEMTRAGRDDGDTLRLVSDYLLLLPDEDIVRTDKFATITQGTARLTGTGMIANNATRELRMLNDVHGTYQPPLH